MEEINKKKKQVRVVPREQLTQSFWTFIQVSPEV
jgi:hypothetical protein